MRCNEKSGGAVIERLSKIYTHVFIDEVQDLAGYDLEILKLLFSSSINTILVGDPRQGTYSTCNSRKNKKYRKSEIIHFFEDDSLRIERDEISLTVNHRSISSICDFSNKLFPELPKTTSDFCTSAIGTGVFILKKSDVDRYLNEYKPMQLRWDRRVKVNDDYPVKNFGDSKGQAFQRVVIYPTSPFIEWLKDNKVDLPHTSRAKLYVAITRAINSVCIVNDNAIEGIEEFTCL